MNEKIDTEFGVYTDTPQGKDPDSHSPTLRRYHKNLWSKTLPNGRLFELVDTHPSGYLHHKSDLGEFFLNSDAITHSYRSTKKISHVIEQTPADLVNGLFDLGSTIGAYTVFPGNKIDNKMTINGARGLNQKILDRFDITLECIRLHYSNIENPLSAVLKRYSDFFALFENFRGYVDFFFFHDLVTADYSAVNFHIPYECFAGSPLPQSKEEYLKYHASTVNFIKSRAKRIKDSQ
jgi:hypothetical protein